MEVPEELTLGEAVGRRPLMLTLAVWFPFLGGCIKQLAKIPMISPAQIRTLSKGLAEPALPCELKPPQNAPGIQFSGEQIRKGLPPPSPFTWRDLRCSGSGRERRHFKRVFFEMP